MLDERDLVSRARQGQLQAMEELFRLHVDGAVRVAYLITGDWREAEDAAQEAFIRAFRFLPSLRPGSPFLPWFTAILVNEARRARRRQSRQTPAGHVHAVSPAPSTSPEESLARQERASAVRRALASLDEDHRVPIALRYLMDLSEADIARALGLPLTTVKSRLFVARRRLRRLLATEKEEMADAED